MRGTVLRALASFTGIWTSTMRNRRFALTVILILGLGIGINVATLGLLYRFYVSPLPWSHGGRIVSMYVAANTPTGNRMSVPTYLQLRDHAPALADAGLYRATGYNLVRGSETRRLQGAEMTASVFSTLGVQPLLGRIFESRSDKPGAKPVAVISYRLWQSLYGGRRSALGATLQLDGKQYTVIGVMPQDFAFPTAQAALWTPRVIQAYEQAPDMMTSFMDRMVARLAPGNNLHQLTAQANSVFKNEAGPTGRAALAKYDLHIAARGWRADRISSVSSPLTLVQFATGLLMLLVWFNLANLFLARTFGRRSELAMRRILGAGTRTLAASLARENLALSLLGALLGVMFGRFLLDLFSGSGIAAATSSIPGASWPVLLSIAFLLGLLSTAIFTSVGIGFLRGHNLSAALGEGGDRGSQGPISRRVRMLLLVSQIALACALAGCGLLLGRSLLNLNAVNLGFEAAHTVTLKFDLPHSQYSLQQMSAALASLRHEVGGLPGIESASVVSDVPFDGSEEGNAVFPRPTNPSVHPTAFTVISDPGSLHALGLPLLYGRNFRPSDAKDKMGLAIIDTLAAKQLFGSTNVVGRQFSFYNAHEHRTGLLFRVIGVVSTSRRVSVGAQPSQGSVYVDRDQVLPLQPIWWSHRTWYLAVRSSQPTGMVVSEIRKTAAAVLPGVPLYNVKTMNQRVSSALASNRMLSLLVGLFAIGALILAAVGLYAVQAYAVAQRAREFAIRIALGAERGRLLAMVVGEAARLLVIGLVIGLAGLAAIGLAFASAFYGISPFDPLSMIAVAAVLCLATLTATWLPAWRASRTVPSIALRR